MKCLIVVAGKSASGKDTLVNKICEKYNIPKVLSTTTRPKRKGEVDGVHYRFVTPEQMKQYKDNGELCNLVSYDVAGGDVWEYGYLKEDIEKHNLAICIANPKGVNQLNEIYEGICVNMLVYADMLVRVERSFSRDDINEQKSKEIIRRLRADEEDFKNLCIPFMIDNTKDGYPRFEKYVKIIFDYIKQKENNIWQKE